MCKTCLLVRALDVWWKLQTSVCPGIFTEPITTGKVGKQCCPSNGCLQKLSSTEFLLLKRTSGKKSITSKFGNVNFKFDLFWQHFKVKRQYVVSINKSIYVMEKITKSKCEFSNFFPRSDDDIFLCLTSLVFPHNFLLLEVLNAKFRMNLPQNQKKRFTVLSEKTLETIDRSKLWRRWLENSNISIGWSSKKFLSEKRRWKQIEWKLV